MNNLDISDIVKQHSTGVVRLTQEQFDSIAPQYFGHSPDGHERTLLGAMVDIIPEREPMTQEAVEQMVMLKGQGTDRWFEVKILDPDMQNDPTVTALMESVSDMIFRGMQGMPFTEANRAPAPPPNVSIITK